MHVIKRLFSAVLILLVVALGVILAMLNAEPVRLDYYFGTTETPLALLIVLSVAAGAVLGTLASLGMLLMQKRRVGHLQRRVDLAEREVRNLRAIPLKDKH